MYWTLTNLIRVTAFVLRFLRNSRSKGTKEKLSWTAQYFIMGIGGNLVVEGNAESCSQVPKIREFEAVTWLVLR